jgi:5-methyltetrahydrofolate--homocysteine methyltransferase
MMTQPEVKILTILERLAEGEVLISDGATGTYLQSHGLEPGGCPEELNVTRPDLVSHMAAEYFDAGADIVLTNSFGSNRFMLQKYSFGHRVNEFNRLSAEHARSATPPNHFVVGSVGPTGEFVSPLGEVSETEMKEAFTEQIAALQAGGADGVIIETMTALEEAALAVGVARENTDLTVMATMTFDKGPRGYFTMMGVTPERAVKELWDAGAHVIGTNCGNGIDGMIQIARAMRQATDAYLLVHSNAGIPAIRKGQIVYPETPEEMARGFKVLVDLGVNIVGGCCGTTPAHIKALNEAL